MEKRKDVTNIAIDIFGNIFLQRKIIKYITTGIRSKK
jgi:hypothetical protein